MLSKSPLFGTIDVCPAAGDLFGIQQHGTYLNTMNKKVITGVCIISLYAIIIFSLPIFVHAQTASGPQPINALESLNITATEGRVKTDTDDLSVLTGRIIGSVLAILGTIFLILIIIGGFIWMTSAGNESRVGQAKSLIIASVIGLVIILISYYISEVLYAIFGGKT